MRIDPKLIAYMNTEAFELVELLQARPMESTPPSPQKEGGSMEIKGPAIMLSNVQNLKTIRGGSISQVHNKQKFEFDLEGSNRFKKFVATIHKSNEINNLISRKFINDNSWDWIFETKSSGKASSEFANCLISLMENSIKEYKVYFHVVYLEVHKSFKIGKVEFGYFDAQFFDKYLGHPEIQQNSIAQENYGGMKETFMGSVYAAFSARAEKDKAESIAFEVCSLSMDVLKVCSLTLDFPQARLDFDIDSRSNINPQSECFVESSNIVEGLTTHLRRVAPPFILDEAKLQHFKKNGLDFFDEFICQLSNNSSDLEKLIVQGIRILAKALSNTNQYQRITDLFTLLESLMVTKDGEPLTETVAKYTSKLIARDKETRRGIIKLLKKMYGVRSAWVHYAKEGKFDLNELKDLQRIVQKLLVALIVKAKTHKKKDTILNEIDDAILGAY